MGHVSGALLSALMFIGSVGGLTGPAVCSVLIVPLSAKLVNKAKTFSPSEVFFFKTTNENHNTLKYIGTCMKTCLTTFYAYIEPHMLLLVCNKLKLNNIVVKFKI